jgi:ribonuclease D
MSSPPFTPDKAQIAELEPFERLPLARIALVATAAQARVALDRLGTARVLGFDTESKPTFAKGEVSDGPHIVQLATLEQAWIFQLHEPECRALLGGFLASHPSKKVGFGLGDDMRRIRSKLGVDALGVVDLNHLFRARGYRKDIGVKTAVAVLFGRRFLKSGKASTSNWAARTLGESQLMYAANDAWAAARVFEAMGAGEGATMAVGDE